MRSANRIGIHKDLNIFTLRLRKFIEEPLRNTITLRAPIDIHLKIRQQKIQTVPCLPLPKYGFKLGYGKLHSL